MNGLWYKNKNFLWSLLIIISGFLVYYNTLWNGFIWDDNFQIIKNPLVHSVSHIPLFFISSLRNPLKHGIFLDFYYKPVMFTFFAILYKLGGGKAFLFHLFQIFLHITNSLLVFFVFKAFFNTKLSAFSSMLFLLHPINEEAVAYIATLQDTLFFFFGILALLVVKSSYIFSIRKIIIVCILLLLSLFSKETGVLFFLLVAIFIVLFQRKNIEMYTTPLILTVAVYAILRIIASFFYFATILPLLPLQNSTLHQRLTYIPANIWFYIREFILPMQTFPTLFRIRFLSLSEIIIPLVPVIIFTLFIATIGTVVWRKEKKLFSHFLFFCFWFLIGLGMHLQIFPLDQMVAKRWFYFPMVGLLGILGLALKLLPLQTNRRKIIVLILGFSLLTFFAIQTRTMNTYWKNNNTIKKHIVTY